ncbi:MAG: 30S ribosomal protein S20 [Atribacteria bacterium 34_128]|jgi:small subunit ribosomal protein S20|nr:MAG: 30S ribosomal protein S20 [Atribacteria bacterium 34_128]
MPQIKSAIKRVKTSEKSHLRNISYKSKIKSSIKKFNLTLSENNKEESIKYFKNTISILDKSVNKGILPKNTASRQKSNLTKKLNTLIKPEQIKKSTPAAPKKAAEAAKKPVAKKAAAPKKKTETKKTAKTKEKPIAKKTVKAVKKPVAKKAAAPKEKIVTTKIAKTKEKPVAKKTETTETKS